MTIARKVVLGFAAIIVLSVLTLVISIVERLGTVANVDVADTANKTVHDILLPLERYARIAQYDVVQVQQFLSDASATHHEDSFNDAAKYAKDFQEQIAALRQILTTNGRQLFGDGYDRLAQTTEHAEKLFPEFNRLGTVMARTYIDQGIKAGNELMEKFDPMSDEITKDLDTLVEGSATASDAGQKLVVGGIDQVRDAVRSGSNLLVGANLVLLAISAAIAVLLVVFSLPVLRQITGAIGRVADGDLEVATPGLGRVDEIGEMARALDIFKSMGIERQRLAEAQGEEMRAKLRRQQESEELIDMFSASVSGVFHNLSTASTNMAETAERMKCGAEQTNAEINQATREVAEASSNAQAVAAASQELTAAISEICRLINQTSQVAEQGSAQASEVLQKVTMLRDASETIGNIVGMISSIAGQTNLLALNATIEAARAGEAGRGFAVVAGEVKSLSNQTQKATIDIECQIKAIQHAVAGTMGAVQQISKTITHVYQSSSEIAAAITEQQSATDEIARNIQFVSASAERVSANMDSVKASADQTNADSYQVHDASGTMAIQTEKMSVEVKDFLAAIKGSGTKHQFERLEADVPSTLSIDGRKLTARAQQLSIAGAWLDQHLDLAPGSLIDVTLQGVTQPIRARIAGRSERGIRLQFPMDAAHLSFMAENLARLNNAR